jgi:hypothetical protein
MDEDEDAYDYDMTLGDTPMDEEHFNDADETLVDISGSHNLEELKGDPQTFDSNDDDNYDNDCNSDDGSHSSDLGKPKARWSEDTVQTGPMSQLGICVNTVARVVVCIACASVIKPLDLPVHFRKAHPPMSITTAFCQELADIYNLLEEPLRSRPGKIITAIYGLHLIDGLFSCDTCGYACRTENRIKIHTRESQGCNCYRPRLVQAFRPNNQMYFGVRLQPASDVVKDPLDPVAFLKAKYSPPPFGQVPIKSPDPCDAHHFLNLEQWHRHVEGKTGVEIHQVVREWEPELRREVRIVVERYAKDAIGKLEKLDHEAKGAIGDYLG